MENLIFSLFEVYIQREIQYFAKLFSALVPRSCQVVSDRFTIKAVHTASKSLSNDVTKLYKIYKIQEDHLITVQQNKSILNDMGESNGSLHKLKIESKSIIKELMRSNKKLELSTQKQSNFHISGNFQCFSV